MKTMKPFSLERAIAGDPIQTRDGRPAKFIAHVPEAGKASWTVISLIHGCIHTSQEDGLYGDDSEHAADLFMAPVKQTRWLNLYSNGESSHYPAKSIADSCALERRLACIQIEFTAGEGL